MKYKITFQENGKISSKVVNEIDQNTINIIKIEELNETFFKLNFSSNKEDEIVLLFYEISMMLSSKLPIKDIIEILLQSHKKGFRKDILTTIDKTLQDGKPIHQSLQIYEKELGYLPLLFFKLGEQNSNLETALRSLYEILYENQKIKNKIKNALQYPFILLGSFFISLGFIFVFVVPKFEYIFLEFGDNLPFSTTILLSIKNILFEDYFIIGILLLLIFILFYFFTIRYRYFFDSVKFTSIPYFSKMERYLIFYKFFLSISLIVKSKHKFQDALFYGKNMTQNQYFTEKISLIIKDINDGIPIGEAFRKANIFDEIAIRMISVGEHSNNLETILEDLKDINKNLLSKNLDNLTAFLNPFFIFIISSVILWLVLAIMTPVWEMGNFIK